MDASSHREHLRSAAGALLLAAVVLGSADALRAAGYSAGIAPARTLPLCLTAPFPIALVVLAPAALLSCTAGWVRGRAGVPATTSSQTALLVGVAGALGALLHVAASLPASGGPLRDASRAAGIARACLAMLLAAASFAVCRRLAAACLRHVRPHVQQRLVAAAALLHLAALAGLAWQWHREGRGIESDLLSSLAARRDGFARGASRIAAPAAARPHPQNLVLVTIDTLRADHLDAVRMPRLERLAREGVRFTQAFASSSWTLPSVASVMTGLSAARHRAGAPIGPDPLARAALDASHATLATALRRAGFATRAVVTNPYLGLGYGLGHGFDAYENVTLESEAVLTLRPTVGFATLARIAPALAIADRGDAVTARAARFLRDRPAGRFFLWLHYLDPHAPYDGVTRSFRDELLAGGGATTSLPRMAQLRAGEIRADAASRAAMRAAYARAVRFADQQVGKIVDLLEQAGLADGTLLVVLSDHGEELWDHGGVEHGHTLYDEVIRVPLVLRCPGCAPRDLRIDVPVATAALAPTVLDLLGVQVEAGADLGGGALHATNGFAPLLRGEPWRPRPVVSENLLFAEERTALRTARHTYVAWPNGKQELYDRARDPRELRDLAARSTPLRRSRELLAALRAAERGGADGSIAAVATSAPASGDAARLRRALVTLGYVE